jgi:hypothetical protein
MVGLAFRAGGIPVVRKVLTAFVDASRDDIYLRELRGMVGTVMAMAMSPY